LAFDGGRVLSSHSFSDADLPLSWHKIPCAFPDIYQRFRKCYCLSR